MKSVHDSIMATMSVAKKKKRLDDEIEQEGHKHTRIHRKKMTNRWL